MRRAGADVAPPSTSGAVLPVAALGGRRLAFNDPHSMSGRIALERSRSEAVLIRNTAADPSNGVEVLRRRLLGVVTARTYVMLDYDCPADLVDRATEITPGLESPTISPLHDPAWVAMRAMVPRTSTNRVMDELYDLGARAILVTDIAACRI